MAAGDLLTQDGQIEWRGLLLGAASPFRWRSLTGWLDLDLRTSDTARDGRHGEYPGGAYSGPRYVTYQYVTKGVHLPQFPAAIAALRAATAPSEDPQEEPLVVQLHGERWMVNARCLRRQIPTDLAYSVGHSAGSLQWKATNPRLLKLPQQDASIGLPTVVTAGATFPLTFNLDLGPGSVGGEFPVINEGNATAWPVWRVTGPVTGLIIENADTGASLQFNPAWTLPAGQTLEIDTEHRTVLLVGSDVSRSAELYVRGWFGIPPGTSRIRFRAASGYSPVAELTGLVHHTSL